jgi:hypothetical protein
LNPQQLLSALPGMEFVDKIRNENDEIIHLVKWNTPTLSYSDLEKIKLNFKPKYILIYPNGAPLHDSENERFIGLVYADVEKIP